MRRLAWAALAACSLAACPPKPPPKVEEPKPPPPTGDLLRIKSTAGENTQAKVKLLIEQEAPNPKAKGKLLQIGFTLEATTEEKVEMGGGDAAQISVRFADATGTAKAGVKGDQIDKFALALDELNVVFKRSTRGEVTEVKLHGLKAPLDEQTAKEIINVLYWTRRGAVFAEGPIDLGKSWQLTGPLPNNILGGVVYNYTYAKKEGTKVTVTGDGTIDGKLNAKSEIQKVGGKNISEIVFDLVSGRLFSSTVDEEMRVEGSGGVIKQHMHGEWVRTGPP
jgi:hypothetical protein